MRIKVILLSVFANFIILNGDAKVFAESISQSSCPRSLPEDICRFEDRVYTKTNFKNTNDVRGVMVGLKQLLIEHTKDPRVIQDHLIGLTDHVLEESHRVRAPRQILGDLAGQPNLIGIYERLSKHELEHGAIVPLDWELPSEIMYFVLGNTRTYRPENERAKFDFGVFAVLKAEGILEQVQVIRYPNRVILDRQAGIGSWNDGHMGANRLPTFSINTVEQDVAQEGGLYFLNIKMRNKPEVRGWFILSQAAPSSNPVIQSPGLNEVLNTGSPKLSWRNYQFPGDKNFSQKKRILGIYSRRNRTDGRVWSSSVMFPSAVESVKLSEAPNLEGSTELGNGSYLFKAQFEERLFFGGLLIGRTARIEVPFNVAK